MAQRLQQKGHDNLIIEKTIEELKQKKLIDDKVFSRLWIGDRTALKPTGKRALVRELKSKGISEGVIDEAFGSFGNDFDEYEIAMPLARKKAFLHKDLETNKTKKRLLDFLTRRGFSSDTIWRILKEIYKNSEVDE